MLNKRVSFRIRSKIDSKVREQLIPQSRLLFHNNPIYTSEHTAAENNNLFHILLAKKLRHFR